MKESARKLFVGVAGGVVLLVGIALLVLPGPAFIVIPAGIAILATEFIWAQRLKDRCSVKFAEWRERHRRKKAGAWEGANTEHRGP